MAKKIIYRGFITCSFIFIMALGLFSGRVMGQVDVAQNETTFRIDGRSDKRVTIPFELVNNLIIIEASVNGSVPLKFILDTGVAKTLITSLSNGEEIYLRGTRTVTLSGLGEGEPVEAFYAVNNSLKVGNIEGSNVDVLFLKEDIFRLSLFMGTYVHGLIGYDLFSNFAVEINYLSKEIHLYDFEEFEEKFKKLADHRKWHKFPIIIEDEKPYIDLQFQHKPEAPHVPLRLLIDTGSSNAFSLYELTHEEVIVPERRINTLIGVGLSGNVNGYLGRIEEMELGDFDFDKPVVAYPDSLAIRRAFSLGDRNGSLGGETLRRFKVIFHYKGGYILVRANRDLGDEFHYNISGIEINTPIPNIPLYVVSDVRKGSPAETQGIQRGDVIRFINGEPTWELSLNEMLNYLQKDQGSRVLVGVERDTLYKKFRFKLDNELVVDN
ncbi:MAG TPA: aspartyl protease family protein [Gracilimonas sp.]|uniref:aspartyl protease family protein n=1 Tax=Gracilimonas sp. TaxID=1974203 RepID=UPI002D9A2BC0|nr:aspartyl protease family protein [Gracilimonas sp.]